MVYVYKGFNNVGDLLGEYICDKLQLDSENYDLYPIGSILTNNILYKSTKESYIFGPGFIGSPHKYSKKRLRILHKNKNFLWVRGKLSSKYFSNVQALGDTGLLVSSIYKPQVKKEHKLGIAVHKNDKDYVLKNYPNEFIISMASDDIEGTINKILSCEKIYSTSLHGLIIAHSYNIPSCHLQITPLGQDPLYKFQDYYSIYNDIKLNTILEDNIYTNTVFETPSEELIKTIQNSMLNTIPRKLFK